MRTELKLITPELAKKYLELNSGNRPISQKLVNYLADQMTRNLWKVTGQGISISSDNKIIDGQHRLRAIVASGKAIKTIVIFDLDYDSFDVYDSGKKRSAADVFSIAGIRNSVQISAIINRYKNLMEFGTFTKGNVFRLLCNHDTLSEYYTNPDRWDDIFSVCSYLYKKIKLYDMSVTGSIYYYLIYDKNHLHANVDLFFKKLFGVVPDNSEITESLRNILIKNSFESKKYPPSIKHKLLIKAWNYYNKGKLCNLKFDIENYSEKLI